MQYSVYKGIAHILAFKVCVVVSNMQVCNYSVPVVNDYPVSDKVDPVSQVKG